MTTRTLVCYHCARGVSAAQAVHRTLPTIWPDSDPTGRKARSFPIAAHAACAKRAEANAARHLGRS